MQENQKNDNSLSSTWRRQSGCSKLVLIWLGLVAVGMGMRFCSFVSTPVPVAPLATPTLAPSPTPLLATATIMPSQTPPFDKSVCGWLTQANRIRSEDLDKSEELFALLDDDNLSDDELDLYIELFTEYQEYQAQRLDEWDELGSHPDIYSLWRVEQIQIRLQATAMAKMREGDGKFDFDLTDEGAALWDEVAELTYLADATLDEDIAAFCDFPIPPN